MKFIMCCMLLVWFVFIPQSAMGQSQNFLSSIDWNPLGNKVVVAYGSNVEVVDDQTNSLVTLTFENIVSKVSWNPDGNSFLVLHSINPLGDYTGFFQNVVSVFDIEGNQRFTISASSETAIDFLNAPAWSPDGTVIATIRVTGTYPTEEYYLVFWNAMDGAFIKQYNIPSNIGLVEWKPNGTQIMLGAFDSSTSVVVDADNGTVIQSFEFNDVKAIDWSRDGHWLAVATSQGVEVINATDWNIHRHFAQSASALYIHPSNQLLYVTGDGSLQIWNIDDGTAVSVQVELQPLIFTTDVSPDGSKLAYGTIGGDSQVNIVDILSPISAPTGLAITSSPPVTLAWQDNSADEDGFIVARQIDGGEWQDIATLPADSTAFTDAACGNLAYRVRATRTSPLPLDSLPSNAVTLTVDCAAPIITAYPSGNTTGPTTHSGTCSFARTTVLPTYSALVPHLSTFRIEDTNGGIYLLTQTTIDPANRPPFMLPTMMLNYGLIVVEPGAGASITHNAAPLPLPTNTIWRLRLQNATTAACQSITIEVNCTAHTATIIANDPTCDLPDAGPVISPPPDDGSGSE